MPRVSMTLGPELLPTSHPNPSPSSRWRSKRFSPDALKAQQHGSPFLSAKTTSPNPVHLSLFTSLFQVKAALPSPGAREPQSGGRPLLLPPSFVQDWQFPFDTGSWLHPCPHSTGGQASHSLLSHCLFPHPSPLCSKPWSDGVTPLLKGLEELPIFSYSLGVSR